MNAEKVIQGQMDAALSPLGKRQASAVATALRSRTISIISSSTLQRARLTAEEIAKFHPLAKAKAVNKRITDKRYVQFVQMDELREMLLGDYEGRPWTDPEARQLNVLWNSGDKTTPAPSGESPAQVPPLYMCTSFRNLPTQVIARGQKAVEHLVRLASNQHGAIVVVSHGKFMRFLFEFLQKSAGNNKEHVRAIHNTSISTFKYSLRTKSWRAVDLDNCDHVKHLLSSP